MIVAFLASGVAWILLVNGFVFVLLAAAAKTLERTADRTLTWAWLTLFAILQALNEWTDMLAWAAGGGEAFTAIGFLLKVVSFLVLMEFARAGSYAILGGTSGLWIYFGVIITVSAGGLAGWSGLNAASHYALALPAGLWSARVLGRYQALKYPRSNSLLTGAWAMGNYAVVMGLLVPEAPFFPASAVNQASFLAFTGIPAPLLRTLLLCILAASLWLHCWTQRQRPAPAQP